MLSWLNSARNRIFKDLWQPVPAPKKVEELYVVSELDHRATSALSTVFNPQALGLWEHILSKCFQ